MNRWIKRLVSLRILTAVIVFLLCFSCLTVVIADEIMILPDTTYIYVPYEKGLHFNLWFEGGITPYSVETQCEGSPWTRYKNKITDDQCPIDFDFDKKAVENKVNSFGLSIKDKKKHNVMWYIMLYRSSKDENWYSAIQCDKPFAKVGDEITITVINENKPKDANLDYSFEMVEDGDIYYTYSEQAQNIADVQETETGYVITAEKTGTVFAKIIIDQEEKVYCISVIRE